MTYFDRAWFAALVAGVSVSCSGPAAQEPIASPPPTPAHPIQLAMAGAPAQLVLTRAPDAAAAPATSIDQPAKLAPLTAPAELAPLAVPDHRDAIVSVPIGATEPRPIVLALHGNFDRPEWQCGVWRQVTKAYPFIVCPRGVPRRDAAPSQDRWTYGKPADVRQEIDAALAALQVRFSEYVAAGPIVYVGFSLGAILGVGIVSEDPERFPRVVLVEGGQSGWTAGRAKSYADAGGRRILFACGQRPCKTQSSSLEKMFDKAGVEARSVFGGDVGHVYDGPVANEVARALPWLVADDPRWSL